MKKFSKKVTRCVLHELKSYTPLCILTLLLSIIYVGAQLSIPIFIGKAIDAVLQNHNSTQIDPIILYCINIAVLAIISAITQWLMSAVNNHITYSVVRNLRQKAFQKIQKLPLSYLDSHKTGDIISRILTDTEQFTDGLLLGFSQLFTSIISILGTLIIMFYISPLIALLVFCITPLSLFTTMFITKKTHKYFKKQSELKAEQASIIDEYIGEHQTIVALQYEDKANEIFNISNQALQKCSQNAVFFSSLTNPTTRFVNNIVYASVALFGAFLTMQNGTSLSVGTLSIFLNYANQYTKPFNEISGVITELQNAFVCASRIFDFIDEKEMDELESHVELPNIQGNIQFDNICFSYVPNQKIIEDFQLQVTKGQTIAIVGPTGCGKTTLINLFMRFYDIQSGKILLDGISTNSLSRHDLRQNIGMVLQDTWIKKASVKENIALGHPNASDEEIQNAAKMANAHSFIRRLPNGYDTILDDGGTSLSQGQRQLLCIARVMLIQPSILILDEATSSIDTRMECKIQDAFAQMMKGRTSLVVAHRLSTIINADQIVVMNHGSIIEMGKHQELLNKKGFYYNLYHSQFADSR